MARTDMTGRARRVLDLGIADAYYISSDENVRYVTGFTGGESVALVTPEGTFLFTDSRYTEQAASETDPRQVQVVRITHDNQWAKIAEALDPRSSMVLGVEDERIPVAEFDRLVENLPVGQTAGISEALSLLRAVKGREELVCIQQACIETDKILRAMIPSIRVGASDYDIRADLLYQIARRGLEPSFDPIVAVGTNGAMPHSPCTGLKMERGKLITIDFGVKYQGYCSDMTRTLALGPVDDLTKTIYDVVEDAQKRALEAAQIGTPACEVDAVARDCIRDRGYGDCFGHGTGHGVGLEIHELPVLNRSSRAILEEGMVFTIEPGVYVPGVCGVRIEDTVVAGAGSLFQFPKRLLEL